MGEGLGEGLVGRLDQVRRRDIEGRREGTDGFERHAETAPFDLADENSAEPRGFGELDLGHSLLPPVLTDIHREPPPQRVSDLALRRPALHRE